MQAEVVCLAYDDLQAGKDLTAEIAKAYGPGGLGILYVRGHEGWNIFCIEEAGNGFGPQNVKII